MGYILLSILAAAFNAALLKKGELRRQNRLVVAGANYVSATLLAGLAWWAGPPATPGPLILGLGAVGGFFYATALFVLMIAVGQAGIAISTAAYRMSLVWPVLLSIFLFGEIPGPLQAAGIVLALVAIVFLTLSTGPRAANLGRGAALWLAGLFFMGGLPFTTLKIFTEFGNPEEKQLLLTCIFFFACVFCWALIGFKKAPLRRDDLTSGAMFGVFNVFSNLSLLYGLQSVPGMLAFPILNTGILLLATLLGVTVWGEKPGGLGYAAVAVSVVAIVLMNL